MQTNGVAPFRIEAPHFVAGGQVDQWDIVVRAAPILRWTIGKSLTELRRYCRRQGWELQEGWRAE